MNKLKSGKSTVLLGMLPTGMTVETGSSVVLQRNENTGISRNWFGSTELS